MAYTLDTWKGLIEDVLSKPDAEFEVSLSHFNNWLMRPQGFTVAKEVNRVLCAEGITVNGVNYRIPEPFSNANAPGQESRAIRICAFLRETHREVRAGPPPSPVDAALQAIPNMTEGDLQRVAETVLTTMDINGVRRSVARIFELLAEDSGTVVTVNFGPAVPDVDINPAPDVRIGRAPVRHTSCWVSDSPPPAREQTLSEGCRRRQVTFLTLASLVLFLAFIYQKYFRFEFESDSTAVDLIKDL
jgi:hypothetical protein